ncbi:MAG: PilN domain-containing protein [Betaproteobacteria bacterium]
MTASHSIAPTRNPSPYVSRLSEFWQWWTDELRALVPARLLSWVVGDVAVTDLIVDAQAITLVRRESGKLMPTARIPLGEVATHPLLRELRAQGQAQVRVLLGADQVLQKILSLPAAIEENLREVMGFELDRHTPFVSSQAYFDVKLLRRDPQRDTIEVLLAVAARAVIDPLLVSVRQAGLSVDGITVAGRESEAQPIELLPANDKPARKWGNLPRLNLALLGVAILLGLLALLLPIWQKREAVIALNPLVGRANADFEVSRRIHDEYTKLANEYNYITGKKQGMHASLAILEELTRISPDTTVVQNLDLKSNGKTREVTLIGEALSASKVIEVLEQSPLFQNASQRSQTRKGSLGTNDWFHVATELKPKPLPAATILGAADPVVAAPPAVTAPVATAPPVAPEAPAKTQGGGTPAPGAPGKPDGSAGATAKPAPTPAEPATPPITNRSQP